MIFCGAYKKEILDFHPNNNFNDLCSIEIVLDKHNPIIYVYAEDENYSWLWKFWHESNTVYEKIKLAILDVTASVNTLKETMKALDDIFYEYFAEILIEEDEEKVLLN